MNERLRSLSAKLAAGAAWLALFGILPLATSYNLATQVVVFAMFALGFNLLAGYGGQLSFGHAAYFGLGAYGTALSIGYLTSDLFVSIGVGMALATVGSLLIGRLSLFRRGVYFAMITLAFGQMVYFGAFSFDEYTGGANGIFMSDVAATIGPLTPLGASVDLYLFSLAVLTVVLGVTYHLVHTPFGRVLVAIQANEERTRHLGYNSTRYLTAAFVLSGAVSGLAGGLFAALVRFVTPDILFWSTSGEVLLITIIGGIGTIVGPVVGAFTFVLLSDWLNELTSHWPFLFGGLFVLVVVFAPDGLYGLYRRLRERLG